MLKFNHQDLSGWSVLRLDVDHQGMSTYELFHTMCIEAGHQYAYEADLLMDANLLATANKNDEYAWMSRSMGTNLCRLVDEQDDEYVNHVLETWPDDVKLFLLRKTEPNRWIMFRLKPATENPAATIKRDRARTFNADLYKAKHSLNWYKNSCAPLTEENKADLRTIRDKIDDLLNQAEDDSTGKETPSDA